MNRSVLSMLLVCCLPVVASAAPRKPVQPRAERVVIDFQRMTADLKFPTGLRVLMQADENRPVAGFTMLIGTGASADPAGKEGLAHLVEHLWFRSTHHGKGEVMDVLLDHGCVANARTSHDWTDYLTVCPSSAAPQVMSLEGKRLTEPLAGITEEIFLTEREVVRNEYRMRQENTPGAMLPYVFDVLYPSTHDYARLRAGGHEALDALTLQDAREFVARHYKPDNAVLAVVGDIGKGREPRLVYENIDLALLHPKLTDDLVFRAAAHGVENPDPDVATDWTLWAWNPDNPEEPLGPGTTHRHGPQRYGDSPPAPRTTEPTTYQVAVEDPVTVVAWSLPGGFTESDPYLQRVSWYASFALQDILPDRTDGGCFVMSGVEASTLMCLVLPDPQDDRERLASRIASGIPQRWSESAWLEQVLRNRLFTVSGLIQQYQDFEPIASLDGRATRLAHHAWYTGSPLAFDEQRAAREADTGKELFKTMRKWVSRDRAVVVYVEPLPAEEWVVDSSETRHHGNTTLSRNPTVPPAQITAALLREAAHPPDVARVAEKTLDNGLRVVAVHHGSLAFVDLSLYVQNTAEPHDQMSYSLSREQTGPASTLPGEWDSGWASGYTRVSLFSASGNLDPALWMLRDAIEDSAMRGSSREWASDRQEVLEDQLLEAYYWRDRLEREALDAGNPHRWRGTWDDYEALAGLSLGDLRTTFQRKYQPRNAILVMVGNIDPEEALERATFHWSGWRKRGKVEEGPLPKLPVFEPEPTDALLLLDDPHETQTVVTLRCTVSPGVEHAMAGDVAADVLDDQLTRHLRREQGAAYWVSASYPEEPNGFHQLVVSTEVQNDRAGVAVAAIREAVQHVEEADYTAESLRPLVLGRALRVTLQYETISEAAGWARYARVYGAGWDRWEDYGGQLAAITPADLQAAVDGCSTHRVMTVTGPAGVIAPQLDEAGIAYEAVDWSAMGWAELERVNPKHAAEEREARGVAE